jgi:AraC-like DNA-binding protein
MTRSLDYRPIRISARLAPHGVHVHRAAPPADLAPYVDDFWQYDVRPGVPFVPIQVYPSGCVVLRFNVWPDRVESILYGPSLSAEMKGCFIGGVAIFGAAFRLERGYSLLGIGLHELTDLRLDLEYLWPQRISEIDARLWDARTFPERVAVMSDFLRKVVRRDLAVDSDFLSACERLVRSAARSGADELAREASVRTLRRQFEKYAGLSLKQMERMLRVQRVLVRLAQRPPPPLSALALDEGFSDQAHLSREFKRLLGMGPKSFTSYVGRLHDPALPIWSGVSPEPYLRGKAPPVVSFAHGVR